jgi:hypothetical protein
VILDEVPLPIDVDAVAPSLLRLDVGLYGGEDGRLSVVDAAGNLIDSAAVGQLRLATTEVPRTALTAEYRLGENIALMGYDLALEDDLVRITLQWACLAAVEQDYTVFLHLVGPDGSLAQADSPPAGGSYPTSAWLPGEVITEERLISRSDLAAGGYRVLVGMYLLETGERLAVTESDGTLIPDGTIELAQVQIP